MSDDETESDVLLKLCKAGFYFCIALFFLFGSCQVEHLADNYLKRHPIPESKP